MNAISRMMVLAGLAGLPVSGGAAGQTTAWDGLVEVEAKRMDAAYLLPGADFRPYTRIMIDPAGVAFHKDWMRNVNRSTPGISRDLTDDDGARIAAAARSDFGEVFAEAFRKAGYDVVAAPGPDVLRLSPAIVNLYINAPDAMPAGGVRSYTLEAGEATLVLEARDSLAGALLGRAIDRRETRRSAGLQLTSSVVNLGDFKALFRRWADIAVNGLDDLKSQSPPEPGAATAATATDEDYFGRDARQAEDMALRSAGVERLDEISARVTAMQRDASGKLVLGLDNGQVWLQVDTTRLRIGTGDQVRIRRASLGSYLLTRAGGGAAIRVRRNR
jgi:hypothetical protein